MENKWQAQDAGYESRIRESFAQQSLMGVIGARLERIEPGNVEIVIPFRPDLTQQDGFMHAGIVTTIMDTACGYAAYTLMPADSAVLSVEFKVNLVNPARGDVIRAVATVKKAGKTLSVCSADAFADGKICATMLATMICLQKPAV